MSGLMILPLFLGGIGWSEIVIIALIILLFVGGRKIPELMKGLGKGIKSFKEGINEGDGGPVKPDEQKQLKESSGQRNTEEK